MAQRPILMNIYEYMSTFSSAAALSEMQSGSFSLHYLVLIRLADGWKDSGRGVGGWAITRLCMSQCVRACSTIFRLSGRDGKGT